MDKLKKLLKKYEVEIKKDDKDLDPPFDPKEFPATSGFYAFTIEALWLLFEEVEKLKLQKAYDTHTCTSVDANVETTFTVEGVMDNKGDGLIQAGDLKISVTENGKSHLEWYREVNIVEKQIKSK